MIISSKKYACETCIKGHRSSACKHTDRPLFEIKKKGRPVTQCEHCRELRKTKQVHVKCICETKSDTAQQGPKSGFESAAFPTGLPPALGASVAFPNSADGASSDSDPGGVLHGHHCKSGDPCNCVQPRSRARGRGNDAAADAVASSSRHAAGGDRSNTSAPAANILERIYALRPIVPRPASYQLGGPLHTPSLGMLHPHPSRNHEGGYAPYGARYGLTSNSPQTYDIPSPSTFTIPDQSYNDPFSMGHWPENPDMDQDNNNISFASLCGCGDDCSCPGCIHHNRAAAIPSSSAYSSCNNPGLCGTCLDCTIMALPPSVTLPPNTALSIYDSSEAIDDWLRTMSASNPTDQSAFQQDLITFQQQQQQQASWNTNSNVLSSGFGGYNPGPNQAMIPFGDRGAVSPHSRHRSNSSDDINIDPRLLPPLGSSSLRGAPSKGAHRGGGDGEGLLRPPTTFLNIPDLEHSGARSRSPSTSSQSSQHVSDVGGGSGVVPPYRPSGRVQGMFDAHPRQRHHQHHGGGGGESEGGSMHNPLQLNMNVRPGMGRVSSSASSSTSGVSPSPGSAGASAGRVPSFGTAGSPQRSAHIDRAPGPGGSGGDGGAGARGSGGGGPSLAGLHIY